MNARTPQSAAAPVAVSSLSTLAAAVLLAAGFTLAAGSAQAATPDPDVGVRCPSGYQGAVAGGAFKCTKTVSLDLTNTAGGECARDGAFGNFQKMVGQRDICVNADSNIPSNANLAEFENGRVLIPIPLNVALPRNLVGRTPVKVVNGVRYFAINPNADFIFYDQSKTAELLATTKLKAVEILEQRQLGAAADEVKSHRGAITTVRTDFSGSLDKVTAGATLTALAR